jgi:hypothetical protein
MTIEDMQFLANVEDYCRKNPEIIPNLITTLTLSIRTRLTEEKEKRLSAECALAIALCRKGKTTDGMLLGKLKELQGYSSLDFQRNIDELEEKQKEG